jgi:energy-coupling factor transporter ATP-binding protein EcfA2
MDSRVAILGANGAGKSTLLHLITGALQPCEGTISKHAALKLAKYSQHSADQLPYDKSPIEYFQGLFAQKYPEKDIMVRYCHLSASAASLSCLAGLAFATRSIWVVRSPSDFSDQAALGWSPESVRLIDNGIFHD